MIIKRDPEEERLRIVEAAAAIIREDIRSSVVETKSYPPLTYAEPVVPGYSKIQIKNLQDDEALTEKNFNGVFFFGYMESERIFHHVVWLEWLSRIAN
ncbi:hypothetical protein TNCV_2214921 [Trichonephila clavipes]|nr:hypothetical protein TNCV_2214921 [Trichonephila clavipes]